jgi:hypothetical protein
MCAKLSVLPVIRRPVLELRAAMRLSRFWQSQGKRVEAYALLAPSYRWLTKGCDAPDLQDAKAWLEAGE